MVFIGTLPATSSLALLWEMAFAVWCKPKVMARGPSAAMAHPLAPATFGGVFFGTLDGARSGLLGARWADCALF